MINSRPENEKSKEEDNKLSRLSSWNSVVSSKWGDQAPSSGSSIRSSDLGIEKIKSNKFSVFYTSGQFSTLKASGTTGENSLSSRHSVPSSQRSFDFQKAQFDSRLSQVSDNIQLLDVQNPRTGSLRRQTDSNNNKSARESTIMTPYTQDFTQTQSIKPSVDQTVRQKRIRQAIDYTILEVSEPETRGYSSGSTWTLEQSNRFRFQLHAITENDSFTLTNHCSNIKFL